MSTDNELAPPQPTPKRRKGHVPGWVVLLTFVLLAGLGYTGWHIGNQPKNGIDAEKLEANLRENLKQGAAKEEALKWFAANGITTVGDLKDTGGRPLGYRALVENDSWLEKAEIEITCRYDRDGKITEVNLTRSKMR